MTDPLDQHGGILKGLAGYLMQNFSEHFTFLDSGIHVCTVVSSFDIIT